MHFVIVIFVFVLQGTVVRAEQSTIADQKAIQYFSEACCDGKERLVAITQNDGVLHELTVNSTEHSVTGDEDSIKKLCRHDSFVMYHCHPTNDMLSLFPGADFSESGDFGTVAYLEFLCAVEAARYGFAPPKIEFRIVHTGGKNEIVRFGLRDSVVNEARHLGARMGLLSSKASVSDTPLGDLLSIPEEAMEINIVAQKLYAKINGDYMNELISFASRICPKMQSSKDIPACAAFSLEAFISTADPCSNYFIVPPGGHDTYVPCAHTASHEYIVLQPRHLNFMELTERTYEAFVSSGTVIVVFCHDEPNATSRSCDTIFGELDMQIPQCANLKRGYVDLDRFPQLQFKLANGWPDFILMSYGQKFYFDMMGVLPPEFVKLVLCGMKIPSAPFN